MFAVAATRVSDVTRQLGQVRNALWAGLARRAVPVLDRATTRIVADVPLVEAALKRVDATLSLRGVRARVVSISDETHDTKTYWLRPNARFGSFRPGSYITLQLVIDGQPVQRTYSLSSAPRADGLISITVKRVPGGRVSNWLADTLRPGHVLELSAPQGQFVLPPALPPKLLLISAGSGITPVMSLLRQLVNDAAPCEVVFMHFARSPRDIIFRSELERIAQHHRNIRVVLCVEASGPCGSSESGAGTDDATAWTGALGRFCESQLQEAAADFRSLDTYLCGPAPFMQCVMQTLERADADMAKLRYERFNVEFDVSMFLEHAQLLRFVRSGSESISTRPRTILEEAESAGVAITSGCRAGNCGTCRSRKRSGVVVDITTGLESSAGDEFIYPCVSVARGTVEIDL
jgi:ferredoxin-NADP reductase